MGDLVDITSPEFLEIIDQAAKKAVNEAIQKALKESPSETALAVLLHQHITRFEQFRGEMLDFKEQTNTRFDAVDVRFDAVDVRFEAVDARFEAVDARFDAVDARFDAMDARFDAVDARFDALEGNMNKQFMNIAKLIKGQ